MRVTLVAAVAGTIIDPEASAGEATLQLLQGRIELQMDGTRQQLQPGEVAVHGQNLREPIRALEESTFLLTIAWPEGAGAWDQDQRQGKL